MQKYLMQSQHNYYDAVFSLANVGPILNVVIVFKCES